MQPLSVIVGMDWADEKHAVFLLDQENGVREPGEVDQTPEAIAAWAHSLFQRFPDTPIAICLEQSRGALIYALMKYESFVLIPVNPHQLASFRKAIGSSEAKDDPNDAEMLAELCAKHADCLRVWKPDNEETRLLTLLCEDRRRLVDQRTALKNRLKSHLKQYFPQALEILNSLDGQLACVLLERWPSLAELQMATDEEICRVFRDCRCYSAKQRERRLAIVREGVPLTNDHAIVTSRQLQVRCTVRQIKDLNDFIREYDREIASVFQSHCDYEIFHSFPGAGAAMGPRLLCAFGTDRERFSSALDVQCISGIAPVTQRSGKSTVVRRRWACNKFLRQTFHEYAAQSIKYSPWAHAYYCMMKERTGEHNAALRALAFKWIRILFRCWKDHTLYDEAKYQQQLKRAGSPIMHYLVTHRPEGN